jgi:drug/metabolite transporter (DMT)-like permease
VPLFSLIIAGMILRTEQLAAGRIAGLLLGFAGVLVLLGDSLALDRGSVTQQMAVIAAAACYAVGSSYARAHISKLQPASAAAGQILTADALVLIPALAAEHDVRQSLPPLTIFSLVWLGLLGSCVAYILYYQVLRHWGATRTTTVTYLIPVVGVALGFVFLSEDVDWQLLGGGALILGGVWGANRRQSPAGDRAAGRPTQETPR